MSQKVPLKESAISRERVEKLATELAAVRPGFDSAAFVSTVMARLPSLELKARIRCVADALATYLPADIEDAIAVIVAALPGHDDATFTGSDFGTYTYAPYSDFIARYACTSAHVRTSLRALRECTKHFTAEDALHYFLNAFPGDTMDAVTQWSCDSDYHVRRLASEGTRPILPWSPRITIPITTPIPVLDSLHDDPSRFVTQSVANHVNDITRIDPDLALATLSRWRTAADPDSAEMTFVTNQSLRTLIKQGNRGALDLLGLAAEPAVEVSDLRIDPARVPIGATLSFGCTVTASRAERVIIDYVLDYPRPTRSGPGTAVFKWTTTALPQSSSRTLTRTQSLRSTASRKLAPGPAVLSIQLNGRRVAQAPFEILPEETNS